MLAAEDRSRSSAVGASCGPGFERMAGCCRNCGGRDGEADVAGGRFGLLRGEAVGVWIGSSAIEADSRVVGWNLSRDVVQVRADGWDWTVCAVGWWR